jgi:hypothetical protein
MEFLYRTAPPAYKGCKQPVKNGSGFLSGFVCHLFGSSTPAYRGAEECATSASTARCWWQVFPATPQYKAPPREPEPPPDEPTDPAEDPDPECECPAEEIHIWPDCPPDIG